MITFVNKKCAEFLNEPLALLDDDADARTWKDLHGSFGYGLFGED
jgi:hypothetical protein